MLSIDQVSHSGMTLTTWIQTSPGQHWTVERELRQRIRETLAANGMDMGIK